ncbi:MAG: hypothetical protein FWF75_01115, partial [Propionibacteriaceae bacterium]|nr:hypothetical protein [Propionibacteriaceae bacterium]
RAKLRLEIVAALGDEAQRQRTHEALRIQAETPDDPLMVTIADLDARFAQINASAPDDEAEALVAAYVTALTQLYSRMGAGTPSVQQAERGAELYDDFHADLVRRIMRAVHEQSDGVSARL